MTATPSDETLHREYCVDCQDRRPTHGQMCEICTDDVARKTAGMYPYTPPTPGEPPVPGLVNS